MTTQPTPQPTPGTVQQLRSLDDDVAAYLEITEQMEQLGAQLASVRHRLADRGVGTHETSSGVKVTVSAPSRRFNADKAWGMLTAEQQALCVSPDAAKMKKQLAGVLVDECMEPGTGTPRVLVK
jgi:hypothetical protein